MNEAHTQERTMQASEQDRRRYVEEFRRATEQRRPRRDAPHAKGVAPVSEAQERRMHVAMADLCVDRGFVNLAQSHLVQARDCPRDCGCSGCESNRLEVLAAKRLRSTRREAPAARAA